MAKLNLEQRKKRLEENKRYGYPYQLSGLEMINEGRERLADGDFVFVSLDLEMHESNASVITEIGISVLDMVSQNKVWLPNIATYHLLPDEASDLLNGTRIADKRHLFAHGESVKMTLSECRIFWKNLIEKMKKKAHNVYLVGHDIKSDLFVLNKNDFEFDQHLPVLDTYCIWTATCPSAASLSTILSTLKIKGKYLHNAGNDAYFALRAIIAIIDPVIREKYGLDIGPSYAEACRLAEEERRHDNDPDALPPVLTEKHIQANQEAERLENLTLEERQTYKLERKLAKIRARLEETKLDMPSNYLVATSEELLQDVDECLL